MVSWSGVDYPLLVDPSWLTTTLMRDARSFHAIASMPNLTVMNTTANPVLVTAEMRSNGVFDFWTNMQNLSDLRRPPKEREGRKTIRRSILENSVFIGFP